MFGVRLIRAILGTAIFLAAAYLFEPSLFNGRLPPELMNEEMLRNIVGVVGAVSGVLVVIDALFPRRSPPREFRPKVAPAWQSEPAPKPKPVSEAADQPEPAIDSAVLAFRQLQAAPAQTPAPEPEPEPEPEPAQPAPAKAEDEPVWGAYVAPDADTVAVARSLVESEYEGRGLPAPPPKPD